ncbi:MAG: hypothetical protein ABIR37_04030 [Candidatus Saccharimonadales bacterium]
MGGFLFVDKVVNETYYFAGMSERSQTQTVNIFRGTMCHIEGALNNQRSFLSDHPGESLVIDPVNDATIRALHMARQRQQYTIVAPLPDVIHAIEGLRRQADSLIATSKTKPDVYADIARIRGNGLKALANMMINDVIAAYELTPDTQYALLAPMESAMER